MKNKWCVTVARWLSFAVLLSSFLPPGEAARADTPGTWYPVTYTLSGQTGGSGFGSSIACSMPVAGNSLIAIGAPSENRVYLYQPQISTTQPAQILTGSAGSQFGTAVVFIQDINGDGREDLAIGAPNISTLYLYVSNPSGISYAECGKVSAVESGFGQSLLATPGYSALVVSNPAAGALHSMTVSWNPVSATCSIGGGGSFERSVGPGTGFGTGLALIPDRSSPSDGIPDLLVGMPSVMSDAGTVQIVDSMGADGTLLTGLSANDMAGTAIAKDRTLSNGVVAFSSTGANSGRGKVTILNMFDLSTRCDVAQPLTEQSNGFGLTLTPVGQGFGSLPSTQPMPIAIFAASRTESATGGSVALISSDGTQGGCGTLFQINNCSADLNQRQGFAMAGGATCELNSLQALIVGSPGSTNGRVDIYLSGTEYSAFTACGAAGGGGSGGGGSGGTSLPIRPDYMNLPTPGVSVVSGDKSVVVTFPDVTPSLTDADTATLVPKMMKKFGISKKQATAYLAKSTNFVETYIVTVRRLPASASLSDALDRVSISRGQSPIQKLRSKRDRISLRSLSSGANYEINYKVEIALKKPYALIVGDTQSSPSATFTAP